MTSATVSKLKRNEVDDFSAIALSSTIFVSSGKLLVSIFKISIPQAIL